MDHSLCAETWRAPPLWGRSVRPMGGRSILQGGPARACVPQRHVWTGGHMSVFTPAEIAYLQSQRLGRIATVGPDHQPHVVPVGFRYNPDQDTIDIGGHCGFTKRKKYRDVSQNR